MVSWFHHLPCDIQTKDEWKMFVFFFFLKKKNTVDFDIFDEKKKK